MTLEKTSPLLFPPGPRLVIDHPGNLQRRETAPSPIAFPQGGRPPQSSSTPPNGIPSPGPPSAMPWEAIPRRRPREDPGIGS